MALVRQLITEAVCVSLVGGAAGLVLADVALKALSLWHPSPEFPVRFLVNADWQAGALALLLAVASGIFLGLVPMQQVWRGDASLVIKGGSGVPTNSRRCGRFLILPEWRECYSAQWRGSAATS